MDRDDWCEEKDECVEDCDKENGRKEPPKSRLSEEEKKRRTEKAEKEKMRRKIEKAQLARETRCGLNFTGMLHIIKQNQSTVSCMHFSEICSGTGEVLPEHTWSRVCAD